MLQIGNATTEIEKSGEGLPEKKPLRNYTPKGIFFHHDPHKEVKSSPWNTEYYTELTEFVLDEFYPKSCPCCHSKLSKKISTRAYAIRCETCHYQCSRLSYTPLHHLKLPMWMFGYVLEESILRHPQVLTATEIHKRLGINMKTARLLKQRVQLFASDQMPKVKELIYKELQEKFNDFKFSRNKDADLTSEVKNKAIPQADSVVLYSASQRANKGRKRHKHTGQTASIYMSDKLGGKQVGTLVHTFGWQKGPVVYDAISNNTADTLGTLLDNYLPKDTPLFTDEGYTFYYRKNKNHRMVNHSAKSKSKRYKFARNRWSKNGVHCQVAEGNNRVLKQAFGAYCWFAPENAQLYLNEFSFLKSLKYFGLDKIAATNANGRTTENIGGVGIMANELQGIFALQLVCYNKLW